MESLIFKTRKDIRAWKRSAALIASGQMAIRNGNVDRSTEHAGMLRRMIDENQALIDRYDPDGQIADGDIEFGDVPPELASTLWKGRPVSYALDSAGRAHRIRPFESDNTAATAAAMSPGCRAGRIGDESWSIKGETDSAP